MKQLEVINISFIRQSYLFLHRRNSAFLVQVFAQSHNFPAWMLPLDRLTLASCLTLLVRTAADCVAEPFHTKEPLKGHTQLTTSIRPDSIQNTHIWQDVLKGLLVGRGPLKLSSKSPLLTASGTQNASSGIPGQVGIPLAIMIMLIMLPEPGAH